MSLLTTRFTEQLGIKYPIICGAMYPCTSPELVAAVCKAGATAIVQPMSLEFDKGLDFRKSLQWIREQTPNPYGVNILLAPGYEEKLRNWTQIALEEGCRFFVTALSRPTWVVDMVKPHGGIVYHDIIDRSFAEKVKDIDVDGFICVNNRAGGHLGERSQQELYDQVKDMGKPLICAGGVGGQKEFKRVMEMGYDGVQMGTRFIASTECAENDDYKQAIVDSDEDDIVITDKTDGVPAAVIHTETVDKIGYKAGFIGRQMMKFRRTRKLLRMFYMLRFERMMRINNEEGKRLVWGAGKSVHEIKKVLPVKDIINNLVKGLG